MTQEASVPSEFAEKNFIEQFCQTFNMYSYHNDLYGRICAHILLGQKIKHIRIYFGPFYIDPRISLFLIQPSGTGKSIPYDLINDVANKAFLKVDDIGEMTDAALVGTDEREEVIDAETKTKVVTYNKVKGKLEDADILHYDEGQMLINRTQHGMNTLAWLQKTLNPIGSGQNHCVKNLAHLEIDLYPTCSLLITSHEISNLLETVLNTGFFQRIVLFPRYIPIVERKNNELLRADNFGKRMFTQPDIEILSEKLNKIGKKYERYELNIDPNVYPVIKSKVDNMYRLIDSSHERVREIMATFVPRYNNLIYIFALQHSCAQFKDKIDIEDIKYGAELSLNLFKEVITWVEENVSLIRMTSKEHYYLINAYKIYESMEKSAEGYVMRIPFMIKCRDSFHMSMNSVERNLNKLRNFGNIKDAEVNGMNMLKVEL